MRHYLEHMRIAALLCAVLGLAACGSGPAMRTAPSSSLAGKSAKSASADTAAAQKRLDAALQLLQDGRRDEARDALIALSRDYPQYSGPLTDLGILYARNKQRNEAIESFRKAVGVNARNTVAWNWLGTLYRETGQFSAAEQAYKNAIAVKPEEASTRLNLAILYDVSLHRGDLALQAYRDYERLAGTQAKAIVGVWIKELELRGVSGAGVAMGEGRVEDMP